MTDDTLTPAEQAYMDSKGETDLSAESAPETPAAEKPVAEAGAEPPAEGQPQSGELQTADGKQKWVPFGAMEEERQLKKEARAEAAKLREELAFLKGQQTALSKGQKPEGMTAQEKADWEKDPIAAGKALEARLDAEKQAAETRQKQSEAEERVAQIGQRHAAEFVKTQPHYFDSKDAEGKTVVGAYNFLRAKAAEALQASNPNATQAQIARMLHVHELNEIQVAARDGVNVSARFWEMALEQGYKPPQATAGAAAAKPGPTEAEKIAATAAAQAASKSLSSAPGGSGDPELTMEAIANMSDREFAKLDPEKVRRVMGG